MSTADVGSASRRLLWWGAGLTAAAALFFPKIEGIKNHGRSAWQLAVFFVPLDVEGLILIPLIVGATFALFAFVGGWAWRDAEGGNRPATVGLVCGILGIVGVVLFWVSAPIVLGGLSLTLGIEARRRSAREGKSARAAGAIALGAASIAVGAIMWVFVT